MKILSYLNSNSNDYPNSQTKLGTYINPSWIRYVNIHILESILDSVSENDIYGYKKIMVKELY